MQKAWFKDIAVSPATIPLLSFSMKPSSYHSTRFPDLEFESLEDAEASYISISQAYNDHIAQLTDYQMSCWDNEVHENPLKIKKLEDACSNLLGLRNAIGDVIDQFNAQAA